MNGLKKQFSFTTALSMVIGMVIGAGIFFQAQGTLAVVQSPLLSIGAWIVAGLITIVAGISVSELAAAIPKTGGIVEYLRLAYGERVASVCGWMLTVVYFPSLLGVFAIFFANTFVPFFGLPSTLLGLSSHLVVALGIIALLGLINLVSVQFGAKLQVATTLGKLVPILLIIVMGIFFGNTHPDTVGFVNLSWSVPANATTLSLVSAFGVAIGRAFFAYGGWFDVGAIAGEMKHPGKDLPRAIILGLLLITTIYTLINIAYLTTFSTQQVLDSSTIAADTLFVYFGDFGAWIANIGVLVSVMGALNGVMLAASRTAYQLGSEYKLPFSRFLQKVAPHSKSPLGGLVVIAILAMLWTTTGQYFFLSDVGTMGVWIFYILSFNAIIRLRKTMPDLPRPFKVPLYPVLPLIAILGGLYFLGSIVYFDVVGSNGLLTSVCLVVVGMGLPVSMLTRTYYQKELRQAQKST